MTLGHDDLHQCHRNEGSSGHFHEDDASCCGPQIMIQVDDDTQVLLRYIAWIHIPEYMPLEDRMLMDTLQGQQHAYSKAAALLHHNAGTLGGVSMQLTACLAAWEYMTTSL